MNRRQLLTSAGLLIADAARSSMARGAAPAALHAEAEEAKAKPTLLPLSEYEPRSMLEVKATHVERSRYPVIDIHTHITIAAESKNGVPSVARRTFLGTPAELLSVMDRKNIHSMVNLTGGYDASLGEVVAKYDRAFPNRFYTFTEPSYSRLLEVDYPSKQALAIERAHRDGARGLKILKTLGLYLRENITSGNLIKIDDPRFDPMWETCGALKMPVAIHVSDPVAFFTPTDRFNERYEELSNHPDWSFSSPGYPTPKELLEARNRVIARHPGTQFIVLHMGNFAENLANVAENLDHLPNMHVDIAARIGELGRQPRTARAFFEKYQDRILFGTDATPHGDDYPQQVFNDKLYEIYYRFLETEDEYFDYAPARTPPQGRWRIYGIGLPDDILHKVYNGNAARELGISIA